MARYVEKLDGLDVAGVSPTSHLLESGEAFRDDRECPGLGEDEALANAPEQADGFLCVPKILEER